MIQLFVKFTDNFTSLHQNVKRKLSQIVYFDNFHSVIIICSDVLFLQLCRQQGHNYSVFLIYHNDIPQTCSLIFGFIFSILGVKNLWFPTWTLALDILYW